MVFRCIVLLVFTILLPIHGNTAKALSEEDERSLTEEISRINEGLPKMVDKVTRWESTVRAGSTISYMFTLLNYSKETAPKDIGFYLYRKARNGYCTAGGDMSQLRDYEMDLSLYYRDVDGTVIASLMFNNDDCPEEDAKEDIIVTESESADTIVVDPEWLSLSGRLFRGGVKIWPPEANSADERLIGKWQNDEESILYQFLANGDAHQITGNKLKLLKYSVPEINKEQRLILLEIHPKKSDIYNMYIQFFPNEIEARVAVVKDGNKTFEKWTLVGGPDMIAIANQYSKGKKPWVSWNQVLASKEYKKLSPEDAVHIRTNWEELFDNNKKN